MFNQPIKKEKEIINVSGYDSDSLILLKIRFHVSIKN